MTLYQVTEKHVIWSDAQVSFYFLSTQQEALSCLIFCLTTGYLDTWAILLLVYL